MVLFAPRGIWCLIKESWIGSNVGVEPSYEMLLGDSRVMDLSALMDLSRAVLMLREFDQICSV